MTTKETNTYRRAELYEEVWKEPLRAIAQRYGVSDVALRKTCRKRGCLYPSEVTGPVCPKGGAAGHR